jgi:hypothetical protein
VSRIYEAKYETKGPVPGGIVKILQAPGLVTISGKNWAPSVRVDLYMDEQDEAHHVAFATPGSQGSFLTSFVVGPTTLGEHWILGIQVVNPDPKTAEASFWIKSTQQLDDRTVEILEEIVEDPDIGLAEIKSEVKYVEDHVAMFDSDSGCVYWTDSGTYHIETTYPDEIRHVSLTIGVAELSGLLDRDSVKVEIHFCSPPTALTVAVLGGWCELDTICFNGTKVYEFDSDGWRITGNVKHPNVGCTWNVTTIGHGDNEPVAQGADCVQS